MSDVTEPIAPPTAEFPREDSLCERCGYALRGLPYEGDCPECGMKIEESDPAKRRPGLPWQQRISFAAWFRTLKMVARHPGQVFYRLRVDTKQVGNARDRFFLLIIAIATGLICLLMAKLIAEPKYITGQVPQYPWLREVERAWTAIMFVVVAILVLTYIEALGVAWFSWRRGWRVPFRLAERVSCYASIGWVPAGILCNLLWLWYDRRLFRGGWYPFFEDERDLLILTTVAMLTILWFEWLVWLGVRRVKYANAR